LLTHDAVWKSQIEHYIPLNLLYFEEDFLAQTYKEKFMGIINKYLTMKTYLANIINKIDPEMKAKSLLEDSFLYDHKNKKEIEEIIEKSYEKIPLEIYLLYRMLNGQNVLGGDFIEENPLFGGFCYYQFIYTFSLLPFKNAVALDVIKKYKFLSLTICNVSGNRLFVDIHNVLQRGHGTIFLFRNQRTEYGRQFICCYIYKPSLLKFLEDLQYCDYDSGEEIISHFDSYNRPLSDVTTRGIRVRTAAIFNPWDRSYNGDLFAYQIRISPTEEIVGTWKLTTRHWIIDDNGNPHDVQGPGVIGLYPTVKKNAKEFTYQSCTPMNGFNGSFKGELNFKNSETGEEIPVTVGEIKLKIPNGSALVDLCIDDDSVQLVAE